MKKKLALFLIFAFIVSCAPLDLDTPYVPVTQISFFASDTPAPFIVPVTETPQIIIPVTETPLVEQPILATDTPMPSLNLVGGLFHRPADYQRSE